VTDRPFQPEHGDIGSWVRLDVGTMGQVWSVSPARKATVYVVDGQRYTEAKLADLRPLYDADQATLEML